MIEPFPILTTDRLTLRPLSVSDAPSVLALRSDAEINQYLDRKPSKTLDDALRFINAVTENIHHKQSLYWAITQTDDDTFVGTICVFNGTNNGATCEIGFELLRDFQGKGIMQEAANRVVAFVSDTLPVSTIEAFTHVNNQRSIHLLEKLGFLRTKEPDANVPDCCVYTLRTRT